MRIGERLSQAEARVRESGSDATAWDARLLLAHILATRNPLALDPRGELPPEAAARFETLWERRLAGVPVQHLLGEWDFYGRSFSVDSRALVPRPETEILIAAALREAPEARQVLDAGTGSGILAITWLLERPEARALALDASLEALALARANAARHGVLERVSLVSSDWVSALGEKPFDLALANPPYLSAADEPSLSSTVRDHEPRRALYAGRDGLQAIGHLLDALPRLLRPAGLFVFEFGFGQAEAVKREIRSRVVWEFVRVEADLNGIPRVAVARRRARTTR